MRFFFLVTSDHKELREEREKPGVERRVKKRN
jgi:hypothetical protein